MKIRTLFYMVITSLLLSTSVWAAGFSCNPRDDGGFDASVLRSLEESEITFRPLFDSSGLTGGVQIGLNLLDVPQIVEVTIVPLSEYHEVASLHEFPDLQALGAMHRQEYSVPDDLPNGSIIPFSSVEDMVIVVWYSRACDPEAATKAVKVITVPGANNDAVLSNLMRQIVLDLDANLVEARELLTAFNDVGKLYNSAGEVCRDPSGWDACGARQGVNVSDVIELQTFLSTISVDGKTLRQLHWLQTCKGEAADVSEMLTALQPKRDLFAQIVASAGSFGEPRIDDLAIRFLQLGAHQQDNILLAMILQEPSAKDAYCAVQPPQ